MSRTDGKKLDKKIWKEFADSTILISSIVVANITFKSTKENEYVAVLRSSIRFWSLETGARVDRLKFLVDWKATLRGSSLARRLSTNRAHSETLNQTSFSFAIPVWNGVPVSDRYRNNLYLAFRKTLKIRKLSFVDSAFRIRRLNEITSFTDAFFSEDLRASSPKRETNDESSNQFHIYHSQKGLAEQAAGFGSRFYLPKIRVAFCPMERASSPRVSLPLFGRIRKDEAENMLIANMKIPTGVFGHRFRCLREIPRIVCLSFPLSRENRSVIFAFFCIP